ncbi:MAG: hypothetical protein L6437_06740 [Kiritimatiellae bacterium]|nr:hypothetical protein [Kiritimatiellia bacterium]
MTAALDRIGMMHCFAGGEVFARDLLVPEPFHGQPNEPAHVRRVAEVLA